MASYSKIHNNKKDSTTSVESISHLSSFFLNTTFLTCLFPFFKIVPFIEAEVQPVAAVFAGAYIFNNYQQVPKTIIKPAFAYLYILIGYLCIGLVFASQGGLIFPHVIESFIIFITPLLIFIALYDNLKKISKKVFEYSVHAWFLLSFLQLFLPSLLNVTGISLILSLTIPRFSSEVLSSDAGGRGVVGFSPEPSYAAQIIVFMLLFSIFLYTSELITKRTAYILFAEIGFMIVANRSGSILLMTMLLLIVYAFFKSLRSFIFLLKIVVCIIIFFGIFSYILHLFPDGRNLRMFELLYELIDAVSGSSESFNILEFENAQGSLRGVSVQTGYLNILRTLGIGSGMGSWGSQFLNAMEDVGFKINSIAYFAGDPSLILNKKPFAYAALLSFDTGLVGLSAFLFILLRLISSKVNQVERSNRKKNSAFSISCLAYSLFGLFYNSPASLPIPWIGFLVFLAEDLKRDPDRFIE